MTSAKPKPTAGTIKQINAAHEAVVESGQAGLRHALHAGELLNSVKDGTDHGDWETWLATNCPNISVRTARLYMQLSDKEEEIEKAAEENGNTVADLSIRGARKLITKKRGPSQTTKPPLEKNTSKGGGEPPAPAVSPDLPTLLKHVGPDELATAIKQADWGMEEIRKLISALTIRMQSLGTQVMPPLRPQSSATPSVRPS